jgi:alkanesulfonate monooxygenase SsuD/methylene tetrahydromethanopterin reductase-like flavin-dependent oxidoreductase (luciferase family)
MDRATGNVFDDIQFYLFNHHHYIDIPPDHERYESTVVDYPNSLFDPERGMRLYERYTRELVLAEQLGFDAIALNEHHSMPYSMMPAVGVRAGYVAAVTSRVKILVAGTPINLSYPSRVAEEYAMLDLLSHGRVEFGFPLGTGMEYWVNASSINPVTARERFHEGLEVILKAWTQDGPMEHDGRFYHYRYLNVWPKPWQKPHPKIFIVGTGSASTVELAAEFDAGYSIVFVPIQQQLKAFNALREAKERRGKTLSPAEIVFNVIAYVADTDEQAIQEARPHIERFFSFFHRAPGRYLSPPGYVSTEEYLRRAASALASDHANSWDSMVAIGRIICGSPQTVADTIAHWAEEAGSSRILLTLQHGDMPEWKTVKNMTLFAEEVIPRIRARASVGYQTAAATGGH